MEKQLQIGPTLFLGFCLGAAASYLILGSKRKEKKQLGPPASDVRIPLTLNGMIDRLYDEGRGPYPFEFNKEVVEVFDDMVSRSVPFYAETIDFLIYLVVRHHTKNSKICDLGCSTGTTLDAIIKGCASSCGPLHIEGVDEAPFMIEECRRKLEWASQSGHRIDAIEGNILEHKVGNASIVILNYTLQFIDHHAREALLINIYNGLNENGILFLSEKVEASDDDMQETCVFAYEDFKSRRGYSKEYIQNKKGALTNVLRPNTERQLVSILTAIGFDHVQTCVKWNCFVSIIARKRGVPALRYYVYDTPQMDKLFSYEPTYLKKLFVVNETKDSLMGRKAGGLRRNYDMICEKRRDVFYEKGNQAAQVLQQYEGIATAFQTKLRRNCASVLDVQSDVVTIGDRADLSEEEFTCWQWCAEQLRPWRKGPWDIFGLGIDAEWRSDKKWERLLAHVPPMKGKVVCDLGCGNGYFMMRMLEQDPKMVVGIDPNLHAWLEFNLFSYLHPQIEQKIKFEIMRGEHIDLFENCFDLVFCLGVLYHTPDPIGVLRNIKKSMKRKGSIIVDCQGIEGDEPTALFPKKKYANMKGVYFLPTLVTLQHWLSRSGFHNPTVLFQELLSPEEQRSTKWADIPSLKQALSEDGSQTIEGYPRPWRFYLKADL